MHDTRNNDIFNRWSVISRHFNGCICQHWNFVYLISLPNQIPEHACASDVPKLSLKIKIKIKIIFIIIIISCHILKKTLIRHLLDHFYWLIATTCDQLHQIRWAQKSIEFFKCSFYITNIMFIFQSYYDLGGNLNENLKWFNFHMSTIYIISILLWSCVCDVLAVNCNLPY